MARHVWLFCCPLLAAFALVVLTLALLVQQTHLPTLNLTAFPGEDCQRACVAGEARVCHFEFFLEHYQAMGVVCGNCILGVESDCAREQCVVGDGIEKGVMSINRRIPGPPLLVCQGDLVVVDVVNRALGTAAAIHWHGVHMRATPFMDGVPFVTQCPIPFATAFRYQFRATEAGTLFYHSHSGHHKVNGQYGALIVRRPAADEAHVTLYDFDLPEHYLLISDWMHSYGESHMPGQPSAHGIYPDSVLINGRGTFISGHSEFRTQVPPVRFYVETGKRYRFRLINAVSHACPFQLQVGGHNMSIIASDTYDVDPRPFDTLVSNSGERYDFVLHANHSAGDFWIRVRGMATCAQNPTEAFALLRYVGTDEKADKDRPLPAMPAYNETYPPGILLNHPNATCFGGDNDHCLTELSALEEDAELRNGKPDFQFFVSFNNFPVPNTEIFHSGRYNHFANIRSNLTVVGAINNLSFVTPDYPPLTQPEDIDESQFCDEFHWPAECAGNRLCPCVHRLQMALHSLVELIVVDETDSPGLLHHPFHLHGHRFMVVGLGSDPLGTPMSLAWAKELERLHLLPRAELNPRPPFKDTVSIPSRGYAVVRFRADNPGFWLMHCHYEWHLSIGMGLLLQVGDRTQMIVPPPDFPRCRNYLPDVGQSNF